MGDIKPVGQQKVHSVEPEASGQQGIEEVKQPEGQTEAAPPTKEKQTEIRHARQTEAMLTAAALKAKAGEPAPEVKKGDAAKTGAPKPEPPVADPERLKKIEEILEKSPTGKAAAAKGKKEGTEFKTGPAGKGSYNSGKTIVVDKNHSPARAALTYVHESHHAVVPNPDPKKTTRTEYTNALLKEEVDGTVLSIETKNELKAAGVDVKGVSYPLEKEYNAAKKKAMEEAKKKDPKLSDSDLEKIGREAGTKRVDEGFRKGEVVTSNTKESYPDYYGKRWDKHNPK